MDTLSYAEMVKQGKPREEMKRVVEVKKPVVRKKKYIREERKKSLYILTGKEYIALLDFLDDSRRDYISSPDVEGEEHMFLEEVKNDPRLKNPDSPIIRRIMEVFAHGRDLDNITYSDITSWVKEVIPRNISFHTQLGYVIWTVLRNEGYDPSEYYIGTLKQM
jgi:hypothetical protein